MRLLVREATGSDLAEMARLHRNAYSRDHFLALLPEPVLADYYGRFVGHGSQILVAVEQAEHGLQPSADRLLGFAVFGRNIEPRIAQFKLDHRWSIVRVALCHPLLSVRKTLTAAAGLRRRGPPHLPAAALLLSIAVGQPGRGVGRLLLEDMLRRCARAGESCVGLYVRRHNAAAINAYRRVGFSIVMPISDQYYMECTPAIEAPAADT